MTSLILKKKLTEMLKSVLKTLTKETNLKNLS